jgi:NTP pyrophosphatase (non-canonical NTP hydrolase)
MKETEYLQKQIDAPDSTMTFSLFQLMAGQTAEYPNIGVNIEYPTLGLCAEAGEVANKVKKIQRDYGGTLTAEVKEKIVKELGDVLWYCATLASELRVDLGDVAAKNLLMLASRSERGVVKGDGDER